MSAFVNYNKRGVELPGGYKDLMDVLHPKPPPLVEHQTSAEMALPEIEEYIKRVLEDRVHAAYLRIQEPHNYFSLSLGRQGGKGHLAIWFGETKDYELKLQTFFDNHRLQIELQSSNSEIYRNDHGVPVAWTISPALYDAATFCRFTGDLFREVWDLGEKSKLHLELIYSEIAKTA